MIIDELKRAYASATDRNSRYQASLDERLAPDVERESSRLAAVIIDSCRYCAHNAHPVFRVVPVLHISRPFPVTGSDAERFIELVDDAVEAKLTRESGLTVVRDGREFVVSGWANDQGEEK